MKSKCSPYEVSLIPSISWTNKTCLRISLLLSTYCKLEKISSNSARFVQIRLRVGTNNIKLYQFETDLL